MRVCGIAGSLRKASYNCALLRAAMELAPPGMEIVPFDGLRDVPLYDADVEATGDPEPVTALKAARTGTARAQLALRQSFVFTQTLVMPGPEVLVAEAGKRFSEDGRLTDETTRRFVRELLERFAARRERLRAR
jgi:chromate reductase